MYSSMFLIFKCLICRKDIERSTKTFWIKKGHLLCSTCLDNIDKKKVWIIEFENSWFKRCFLQKAYIKSQLKHYLLYSYKTYPDCSSVIFICYLKIVFGYVIKY